MDKIKQGAAWAILLVLAILLLLLSVTGRLGIFTSIAFVPDNVAYIGGKN